MHRSLTGSALAIATLGALSWNAIVPQDSSARESPVDVSWHTDLAAANAIAIESGRPLLVVFR